MNIHLPNLNELFQVFKENIGSLFLDITYQQHVIYLVSTYAIGYLVYTLVFKKKYSEFAKDAFSKDIWLSKSALVDYSFFFLFLAGISTGSIFGMDLIPQYVNFLKSSFFADNAGLFTNFAKSIPLMMAWTLVLIVIADFINFLVHWMEHKVRFLWSFHAIHHSAKRLNPFVNYRVHPVELFIVRFFSMVITYAIFAILTISLFGTESVAIFFVFVIPLYIFFSFLHSNLRHTEIWIKFPRKLSHIFCSPAMHQIHHSNDPKWFGKNMSFIFSIWDWLFGTIYIPTDEDRTHLNFGLREEDNISADSFVANIIYPIENIYKWALKVKVVSNLFRYIKHGIIISYK